jgi:hypothetical protein
MSGDVRPRTHVGHRVVNVKGEALNPLLHLLYSAAAHIPTDIRFTLELVTQVDEPVGPERLFSITPQCVFTIAGREYQGPPSIR